MQLETTLCFRSAALEVGLLFLAVRTKVLFGATDLLTALVLVLGAYKKRPRNSTPMDFPPKSVEVLDLVGLLVVQRMIHYWVLT